MNTKYCIWTKVTHKQLTSHPWQIDSCSASQKFPAPTSQGNLLPSPVGQKSEGASSSKILLPIYQITQCHVLVEDQGLKLLVTNVTPYFSKCISILLFHLVQVSLM